MVNRGAQVLLVLVLVVIGVVLVVFFPGPSRPAPSEEDREYQWINSLSLTAYPRGALPSRSADDRVGRFLDRLRWGHTDVQNWTARHLESMGSEVGDRAVKRLGQALQSDPFYARKLLQLLSKMARPEFLSALEPALHHDYDFVRMAAVRVIAGIDSDAARSRIAELTRSLDPALKDEAYAAMRETGGLDAGYVVAFLEEVSQDVLSGEQVEDVARALRTLASNPTAGGGSVVARLLEAPDLAIRLEAGRTLLAMRQEEGRARELFESVLRDGDPQLQSRALAFLAEARQPVDLELLDSLATEDSVMLAIGVAQLLGTVLPDLPPDDPRAVKAMGILRRLAAGTRPRMRLEALVALYKAGDRDVSLRFLEKIRKASGNELRDAVQILAERFQDPRGIPALRERLADGSNNPLERSHLLHGLAVYQDAGSVRAFIDDISKAGTPQDLRADRIKLSYWATVKIQALGDAAAGALMDLLESRPRREVMRLALDALRKLLAKLPGSDRARAIDLLESLARDRSQSDEVRIGAVVSFPFLDDLSITQRLLDLGGEINRPAVTSALNTVLANYF